MATPLAQRTCPCESGVRYVECCATYHRGDREPETCEALMRARYAAFATRSVPYLWRTLAAEHEDRARPEEEIVAELRATSQSLRFMGLTVVEAAGDQVLFIARVFERGRDRSFIELSDFQHDGIGWRYRRGIAAPLSEVRAPARTSIAAFVASRASAG